MKTIRLTTSQALVKFLNQQYVEFDGKKERFIKGSIHHFWTWKCGRDRASAAEKPRSLKCIKVETSRMAHAAVALKTKTSKANHSLLFCRLVQAQRIWLHRLRRLPANNIPVLCFCQAMCLQLASRIGFFNELNKRMIYLFLQMMPSGPSASTGIESAVQNS